MEKFSAYRVFFLKVIFFPSLILIRLFLGPRDWNSSVFQIQKSFSPSTNLFFTAILNPRLPALPVKYIHSAPRYHWHPQVNSYPRPFLALLAFGPSTYLPSRKSFPLFIHIHSLSIFNRPHYLYCLMPSNTSSPLSLAVPFYS